MPQKQKKCDHPACNCRVGEGTAYCSPYCHDAKGTTEISCNCGHAGCAISEGEAAMTGGTTYS